jgi:hypothetical protein
MKRHSSAGGKARRGKAAALKRRNAPKAMRQRRVSRAEQETAVAWLNRERDEALEQQTATSNILDVISSSRGELQAVFDIILKNANRLCDAKFGALFIYENGVIRVPSHVDLPPPLVEHFHKRNDQPPVPGTAIETLIRTKRLIHIPDQRRSPEGLSSPATKAQSPSRTRVCSMSCASGLQT